MEITPYSHGIKKSKAYGEYTCTMCGIEIEGEMVTYHIRNGGYRVHETCFDTNLSHKVLCSFCGEDGDVKTSHKRR